MLLLFGTGEGTDDLYLDQKIRCPLCGKKAELQGYCTYQAFRLFFLPVFRWDMHYFVRTSCCGALAPLSRKQGEAVDAGAKLDVRRLALRANGAVRLRVCPQCGYETSQPFAYCPLCGRPFGRREVGP